MIVEKTPVARKINAFSRDFKEPALRE